MGLPGDFNVFRHENERLNCTRRTKPMRDFSALIQDLVLIDLPLEDATFTWS